MMNSNYKYCQKCEQIVKITDGCINCSNCGKCYCAEYYREHHPGLSCSDSMNAHKEFEAYKKQFTTPCPRYKALIEKI
jgi:hypothetical protein